MNTHGNQLPEVSPHRKVSTDQLFRGDKTLIILHAGFEYRLQITRSKKLILTK